MRIFAIATVLILLASCQNSEVDDITIATASIISYDLGTGVNTVGSFRATQVGDVTNISISLKDQTQGSIHGIQVYEGTCDELVDVWNTGTEENYCNVLSNGEKWFKPLLGNAGNIAISSDGTGQLDFVTTLWKVGSNDHMDIIGKLIVILAGPKDFLSECDPNHIQDHFHPNIEIACGEIQLLK